MLATATMKGAFLMVKSIAGTAPTTTPATYQRRAVLLRRLQWWRPRGDQRRHLNVTYTASA